MKEQIEKFRKRRKVRKALKELKKNNVVKDFSISKGIVTIEIHENIRKLFRDK